jgi:hypothetical protein
MIPSEHGICTHGFRAARAYCPAQAVSEDVVDVALSAAMRVAVRRSAGGDVEGVERDRFRRIRNDIAEDELWLGNADEAWPQITIRPNDLEYLAIVAAVKVMWRMGISAEDGGRVCLLA